MVSSSIGTSSNLFAPRATRSRVFLALILLAAAGPQARAQNNNIVASGVAWPAFNLAPETNPVGALYSGRTFLSLGAGTANPLLGSTYTVTGRIGTTLGRSAAVVVGAGASLGGGSLSVPYALAWGGKSFAIGVGGNILGLHNLGMIFGPLSKTRFGVVWGNFIGLASSSLGLGLVTSLGRSLQLGLDASTSLASLNTWSIRPGLMIGAQKMSLNVSYGMSVGGAGGFTPGTLSAGLALPIGKFNLQAFYNILSTYYANLTMRL